MDESALERYFDLFIADDNVSKKEEVKEEVKEEAFLSLHSGELLTLGEDNKDSSGMDYNSQNPTVTAAESPGGSSTPTQVTSKVTSKMPVTQQQPIPLQIQNVMSTVNLGCSLDLSFIARNVWNVEYQPQRFAALIMRIRKPRTTALVYQSGKMVCVGAKSEEQSRLAASKFARKVQKLGFPVCFLDFRIRNIMACCDMFPVCLERLGRHESCSYEPELFPGLFYSGITGISVTIFPSGKISITGAKTKAELYEVFAAVSLNLRGFRRKTESSSCSVPR